MIISQVTGFDVTNLYTHFRFVVNAGLSPLPFDYSPETILTCNDDSGNVCSFQFNAGFGSNTGYHFVLGDWHLVTDSIHLHTASPASAIPDIGEQINFCSEHVDQGTIDSVGTTGVSGNHPLSDNSDVMWVPCRIDGHRFDD